MKTNTASSRQHAQLVKRYHTLATKMCLSKDDKAAIMQSYGVESSLDLSVDELAGLCSALEMGVNAAPPALDKLRKQAMASIGGWLRTIGRESDAAIIKGIACRATGYNRFNDIPAERLRNLYNLFLKKQKDFKAVDRITQDELDRLTICN